MARNDYDAVLPDVMRGFNLNNESGAASKKLAKLTFKLFGSELKDKVLTDDQRKQVRAAISDLTEKTVENDDDGALYAHETVSTPPQTDSTSVQAQTLTNSRATTTKSTNKMKDKAIRGVEAKLIHIRTPDNVRKAVWLEPVFYEALERVTATRNKDKWLTDILVNVGEGNLASAVRCSIVKELLV